MQTFILILLIFFSFSLVPIPSRAAVTIQRTGAKTYKTIQAALNAAVAGDKIFLSKGNYIGSGNGYNIFWPAIDGITLIGAGSNETVISAGDIGRAIKVIGALNLTIESLSIKDGNVNGDGAGIYLAAKTNLWMKNVVIKDCSAKGHSILAGTGGAVNSSGSYVNARNCSFTDNSASFRGGAAYGGTWEAYNCTFAGNRAVSSGGVVFEGNWKAANCVFRSNICSGPGGVADTEMMDIENCIFYSNKASYGGVAWGGAWKVRNCTFNNNISQKGNTAYAANWNAVNSIFWGSINQFEGGSGILRYCNISGGFRNLELKDCIIGDPKFRAAASGDFHLLADSPCVNAGTSEVGPGLDIEGNSRPYPAGSQGSYDIGAYEFIRPSYDIYVSPAGKDSNSGKSNAPLRTLEMALAMVDSGRTIFLKKGFYQGPVINWPVNLQDITIKSLSGTWEETSVSGYGTFRVFDLSSVPEDIRGVIDGIRITAGSTADAGGGVLFRPNSNIILKNCLLEGNSAGKGGGACNGTAINCVFSNNIATKGGGAYNTALEGCTLLGNSAEAGGGAYTKRIDNSMINCVFADNLGYGIYLDNDASVINCSLSNNTPNNVFTDGGKATIVNCISWNGPIDRADGTTNSVSYSDIQSGKYDSVRNNISSDPKFVDGSKNDLRLSQGSPCINAGTAGMGIPMTDINGRSRVDTIDIGAYEYSELNIQMVQPGKYGVSVNAGDKYAIKWKVTSILGNSINYPYASLYFSKNAGKTWQAIEETFKPGSDKTYIWTAPTTLSKKCRIAVEVARTAGDTAGRAETAYDFMINDTVPPKITIGNIPRYISSSVKITWEVTDLIPAMNAVKLELTTDGSNNWSMLGDDLPMTGSYSFSPGADLNIDYPYCGVRLTARDLAGNVSTKEASFGIDTKAPTAEIKISQGVIPRMGFLRISPSDEHGISTVRINNGYTEDWQEFPVADMPQRIVLAPPSSGNYDITIEVFDLGGNMAMTTKTISLMLPATPEITCILVDGIDVSRAKQISGTTMFKAGINDFQADLKSFKFTVKTGNREYSAVVSPERSAGDPTYYTAAVKMDIPAGSASFSVTAEAMDEQGNISSIKISPSRIKNIVSVAGKPVNLPNPFRPKYGEGTAIKYVISAPSDIKLVINDAKGNAMWLRDFGPGRAGGRVKQNYVFWNGKSDAGGTAANGTYTYIIYSGGKAIAKGQLTVIN